MPETKSIKLDEIVIDAGTQIRAAISDDTVERYAEEMLDGVKFPPLVVFWDSTRYILADGFHRFFACATAEFKDALCEVRVGGKPEALRFALTANVRHGLPRTNEDKRQSVKLALEQWPSLSSREIAKACAVSHVFVESIRGSQLVSVTSSIEPAKRTGADGKSRKQPAKRTVKASVAAPCDESVGACDAPTNEHSEKPHVQTAEQELVSALGGLNSDDLVDNILAGFSRDVKIVAGMDSKYRVRVALAMREMAEGLEQ